ncbi:SMC-Scp complex subunit ScpB [Candidatus Giovannonibacteria bacterium]|nr:SMC-Scp complex subunit ScpB [Candidatus Giovannonibacteria bacterium]
MEDLPKKIEALLFVSGEGLSAERLASQLKKSDKEINDAIASLKSHLEEAHELTVLQGGNRFSLVTSPAVSKLVEEYAKEEFAGELSKASLETLAIVAYKGPIKRSEIDFIRGVNSSFMLRNLLMRGLIERSQDPKDARSYIYRVSVDFLKFLGVTSISDLPEFGSFAEKLDEFLKTAEAASHEEKNAET